MIRRAVFADRTQIEAIYDACFPGEEAFRAWFFHRVWKAEHTLLWDEGGQILSCLQDIPVELMKGKSLYPAHYIYAAGTLPHARGRGLMGRLLGRAFEDGVSRGQLFSTLITQDKGLFAFYHPFGYTTVSAVGTARIPAGELPVGWHIRPAVEADFEAIDRIYRAETAGRLAFMRDKSYYAAMLDLYGDNMVVLIDDESIVKAYAFAGPTEKTALLSEVMGPENRALASGLGYKQGLPATLQGVAHGKENQFPLGCVKALTADAQKLLDMLEFAPYLNIMFN